MRSIVLENKTGIWILRTDSQLEFGHHVGEFGHQQCDTLGSSTGRINSLQFMANTMQTIHSLIGLVVAVFGRVTPS